MSDDRAMAPVAETGRLQMSECSELTVAAPRERALDRIADLAAHLFEVPIAVVSLVNDHRYWVEASHGLDFAMVDAGFDGCPLPFESDGVVVVEDTTEDARLSDHPLVVGQPHIRFYASAPLVTRSGHAVGRLCLFDRRQRGALSPKQLSSLRELAHVAMELIEPHGVHGYVDPTTHLPGRSLLTHTFKRLIEGHEAGDPPVHLLALEVCDPEQLNEVIRLFGHPAAEMLQRAAAGRMTKCLPSGTVLTQMSPIRFCVLLPSGVASELSVVRQCLLTAFREPITVDSIPLVLNTKMGVASYPHDAEDADSLLQAAVVASHHAREDKVDWAVFDRQRFESIRQTYDLFGDLRQAVEAPDGQLSLVYQPKVVAATGRIVGVEALLRWNHPRLGNVPPSDFVPLAEQSALIGPLTDWVVAQAIKDAAEWPASDEPLIVAVNVSMKNIQSAGFLESLTEYAKLQDRTGIRLEIELTESVLMTNLGEVWETLNTLRAMGINISIDDYGTGHSSLVYLRNLPADVVKIDKSFVGILETDERDQIIVRSTIDLAKALGFKVVAEGVETAAASKILRDWGCDVLQGYFISRPLPAHEIARWMKNNRANTSRPGRFVPEKPTLAITNTA
ncbi:MAG: hypothetical protein CMM50_14035 [Rhodospirillaceae bacterium]|nr:hypothetical protein [Rhodospirillaceae bacterium]